LLESIYSAGECTGEKKVEVVMKKQSGFTLIELVIVVVILGFLAVTAIPKFLDLTDQAKQANIEGMAGGFATGISLARAQWEAEGRTNDGTNNTTVYDGVTLYLTVEDSVNSIRPGYALGTTATASIAAVNCISVWNNLFQQPPTIAEYSATIAASVNYIAATNTTNANNPYCIYYLKETLDKNATGGYKDPGTLITKGNNFTYSPANSTVAININVNPS
jgi:MSHA pilin protein MshB